MLKLKDVEYLHEWQWHWEPDRCSNSDTEKRSEMHDVYRYRWDIHNVCDRAIGPDHDNKHDKYSENDETEALSSEHIHR